MRRTTFALIFLTVLFLVGCGSDQASAPGPEPRAAAPADAGPAPTNEAPASDDPFVIGALDSLTGVGESYGVPLSQSKLLAVEEINAAGGINGRMLRLVIEDSKCTANDAITAFRRLVDVEEVKIIIGATCSGGTLGVAPLAEKEGIVLFSPSSTSPDITNAGDYIFRTALNSGNVGIDIANTMWVDGIQDIASITESTDYVEGVRRTAVARFEELGGTVVASERYSSDVIDFRSSLTKLLAEKPDALLLASQGEASGGTIVKQARELGYDGPIYSEVVPTASEALSIAGEDATGLKAVVPNPDLSTDVGVNFLNSYKSRYDGTAPWPWFQGSAYDDVYIAAECLSRTNDDQDADGFRDCLYDIIWSGAIGDNYSFDQNGDVVGLTNVVIEILPVSERNDENLGYRILGPPPIP